MVNDESSERRDDPQDRVIFDCPLCDATDPSTCTKCFPITGAGAMVGMDFSSDYVAEQPCSLRGTGTCSCPTACKLNMQAAMPLYVIAKAMP